MYLNCSSILSTSREASITCDDLVHVDNQFEDESPHPISKRHRSSAFLLDDTDDETSNADCDSVKITVSDGPLKKPSSSDYETIKIPLPKRRCVSKSEEDAKPLPDPFPLPKHFGSEVEIALKSKTMTNATRQAFIAKVAAAMLCYKRYPISCDYENVGRCIILLLDLLL